MEMIELKEVSKTYLMGEVEVRALKGVNLKVKGGEFVVILGPSGSGKTTLLNLIGGIDHPTSGRLWVDGEEISRLEEKEMIRYRREKAGFIFQHFNLIPTLTALENVELAAELIKGKKGVPTVELFDLVGLKDKIDYFPTQLSGGEQQRVAIARALAKSPRILLCDEPTGELDYETGLGVLKLLGSTRGEVTTLFITHNSEIAKTADKVIRLKSGEIKGIEAIESPINPEDISW